MGVLGICGGAPGARLMKGLQEEFSGTSEEARPKPGLEGQRGLLGATGNSVPKGMGTRGRMLI